MTVELNTRVEINNQAILSEDRCTLVQALRIDGVWYDLGIDPSQKNSLDDQSILKVQKIWARIAEQALPLNQVSSMTCVYNCDTQKASVSLLSEGKEEDVTDRISFNVEQLKTDLEVSPDIVNTYFGTGDRCTVHQVIKYIHCALMIHRSSIKSTKTPEALEATSTPIAQERLETAETPELLPAPSPKRKRVPPTAESLKKKVEQVIQQARIVELSLTN